METLLKAIKDMMSEERERRLAELEMVAQLIQKLGPEVVRAEDPALTFPVVLGSDGRITVPEAVRAYLGVGQGDILVIRVVKVVRKGRPKHTWTTHTGQ